jgi:hypothetical protein
VTTALAVVAIAAAAACPLHMLWQRRRGRRGRGVGCVAPHRDTIAERQRRLAARVEELSRSGGGDA